MAKLPEEYYLMHKDIPVCLMELAGDGSVSRVRRNEAAADHFPIGGQMNDMKFHEWWKARAVPKTRHGAKTALQKLGYASTESALVNNLGLSLSDCYWICPRDEKLQWKDVNLFVNDFVDTFGEITINPDHEVDLRNETRFSCTASQGELQKKWCIDKSGRRYMVKGNYGESYQQSLNEIFATELHKQQGFDRYTPYTLTKLQLNGGREGLGCLSYDFCSEQVESFSAWELLQTIKYKTGESLYFPLRQVCLGLGMKEDEFADFLDYQIMSDYLITNTDRHMNNIAVLRDPDTLRLLGFAPIYDSGNSMFYNVPYDYLTSALSEDVQVTSFVRKESHLLKYVHDRKRVDLSKAVMDFSIYEKDITERHIRIPRLKNLYEIKLDRLEQFQSGKDIWKNEKYSV